MTTQPRRGGTFIYKNSVLSDMVTYEKLEKHLNGLNITAFLNKEKIEKTARNYFFGELGVSSPIKDYKEFACKAILEEIIFDRRTFFDMSYSEQRDKGIILLKDNSKEIMQKYGLDFMSRDLPQ